MIFEPNEEKPLIIETDHGPSQFVFSPHQWRIGQAQAVKDAIRYPIQRRRWLFMRDVFQLALQDRAAAHQASERQIVTRIAYSAFRLTLPDLPDIRLDAYGEPIPGTAEAWCRTLKQDVNRLATEDLLGLDWRPRRIPPRRRSVDTAELNAMLEIDLMLPRADLGEDERTLLSAYMASDGKLIEVASRLGWRYDLTRQRWSRLLKKLRAS